MAKQELSIAKQEKAQERIKNFRSELQDYRSQFSALKTVKEDALQAVNRGELLGRRPYVTATPENPYATASVPSTTTATRYGMTSSPVTGGAGAALGSADEQREAHAIREQHFFSNTNNALDEYIMRGQAVLGSLSEQKEMMKNTQKRLYSVANTLGVSGETIRMVERRAKEDKWIFWGGVIIFLLFCWLCIHFLR